MGHLRDLWPFIFLLVSLVCFNNDEYMVCHDYCIEMITQAYFSLHQRYWSWPSLNLCCADILQTVWTHINSHRHIRIGYMWAGARWAPRLFSISASIILSSALWSAEECSGHLAWTTVAPPQPGLASERMHWLDKVKPHLFWHPGFLSSAVVTQPTGCLDCGATTQNQVRKEWMKIRGILESASICSNWAIGWNSGIVL